MGHVLVVEDDEAVRHGVVAALRARGYEVTEAARCDEALRHFGSRPDVVIIDLRLPDGDAVELLPRLRELDPTAPVYVITGFATIDIAVRAVKQGAEEFFTKPVEMAKLLGCVERGIERRRATATGQRARFDVAGATDVRTLEEVEREHIVRSLEAENGRVKDAARRLGVPRSTLYQKIKNFGITIPARTRQPGPSSNPGSGDGD